MIEVGEYVRTNEGIIDKVDSFNINTNIYHCKNGLCIDKENKIAVSLKEVKHSKNIIDLIEVGDIVNGKYVSEIKEYKDGKTLIVLIGIITEDDIKTILTKEQYMQNCYRIDTN